MADQRDNGSDLPQRDAGARRRSPDSRITGRSSAGTKFAADPRRAPSDDPRAASAEGTGAGLRGLSRRSTPKR